MKTTKSTFTFTYVWRSEGVEVFGDYQVLYDEIHKTAITQKFISCHIKGKRYEKIETIPEPFSSEVLKYLNNSMKFEYAASEGMYVYMEKPKICKRAITYD